MTTIFTPEFEKNYIDEYVRIRLDKSQNTLKAVLNKMSSGTPEYNKQAISLLESFLIDQVQEWFELSLDTHWKGFKESMTQFVNTKAKGLSINWNDIQKALQYTNDSHKAIILGDLMSFDLLNSVDYMPVLKNIMNSNADLDLKSHLLGMTTLMRPTNELKPIYDKFLEQKQYIAFPLMCAAISTKDWIEKHHLELALEQTSTQHSIPDTNSDYTHELLSEIYDELFHDLLS